MNIDQLISEQQALVDGAKTENRDLSADETSRYNEIQRQIDDLRAATAPAVPAATAPAAPADPEADTARALECERSRVAEILAICRDFGLDPAAYVSGGASVDAVRSAVLDSLRRAKSPVVTQARVTETGEEDFRRDMADGLAIRSGIAVDRPSEGARQMANMSLRDIGLECLERSGCPRSELSRMSQDAVYSELVRQFYNPTAAFPAILDSTIEKSIVHLYNQVPTTFQEITTKGSLRDFKATADHEYVIGGVGDFLLVPEGGEIKADLPRTEVLPQRQLATYGRQFSMTRQAFINDDIGFLTEVPGLYAAAAKKTIDKQVYSILFNGKTAGRDTTFADGRPLFCTDHHNLAATASAPTPESIQKMILLMQRQTDHFGEPIYMTPRTMVVGVGYEFDLAVIFRSAQVVGSSNNDINPLYNYPLTVVQSPVLNALAGSGKCPWFMLPDLVSARGIQVDYLNGQETPTVRRMETPGQLGFVWDIYLDWGIAIRDYRGVYRNDGDVIA